MTLADRPRRGGRLARPERGRQVDGDQDADRGAGADRRAGPRCAGWTRCAGAASWPAGSAWCSGSAASCGGTCRCGRASTLHARHPPGAGRGLPRTARRVRRAAGHGRLPGTPVRQLSLGQRMRGEITAALLHAPELLVLDEPTIGLDLASKERLRTFLAEVNARGDVTLLLTTHDLPDVERLCRRVVVIDHGPGAGRRRARHAARALRRQPDAGRRAGRAGAAAGRAARGGATSAVQARGCASASSSTAGPRPRS